MVKIVTLERVQTSDYRMANYKDFSTSFPASGVKLAGMEMETPQEAEEEGRKAVREYEQQDIYGNMGEVCGVMKTVLGYRAVICTYHSNT